MASLEQPFLDAISTNKIDGVVIEARSREGSRYSKSFGSRTLLDGSKKDLSSSDILFLASATKLLTAIAALQCCERNLLSLDQDLRTKYPEWFDRKILLKWDENDAEPTYKDVHKPLTLKHLLTHSSGFIYHFFDPAAKRLEEAKAPPKGEEVDLPARFGAPLNFVPGEGWMYGTGLDWAGHLVEVVSGMKLDEYFRTNLLGPLGIAKTELSFFPVKEGLGDRMPDLNPEDPKGEGKSVGGGHSFVTEGDTTCYGGHGAFATADAYVTILHSILADDGKLLRPASVAEMFKPQLEPAAKQSFAGALAGPMGFMFGQGTDSVNRDYGLSGLLITEEGDGLMDKGALTWGGGYNSAWVIDPKNGVCGFVAPQLGLPPDGELALKLKSVFKRELKNVF